MKLLYANGDSWTQGEEIPREYYRIGETHSYYKTWPWYLSQLLDIPLCINDGAGAGSNDRIFRKTLSFINKWIGDNKSPTDLVIVVGWTNTTRTEIMADGVYHRITSHGNVGPPVDDNYKVLISDYAKAFYSLYDDDNRNRLQVDYMVTLRLLCSSLNIRYYDFVALGYELPTFRIIANKVYSNDLLNMCGNSTWAQFVYDNAQPTYPFGHPKPDTHELWAKELAKEML